MREPGRDYLALCFLLSMVRVVRLMKGRVKLGRVERMSAVYC